MKSKVELIRCDYCNSRHEIPKEQAISVSAPVGRQGDAAGGTETVFLSFDICPAAAEILFRVMIDNCVNMDKWLEKNIERSERA